MGMSIDESRQLLSQYQKLFNSLNGDYKLSQVQISELSHSISTALDAMRKYQKIKKLIKQEKAIFMMDTFSAQLWLHKIKKVVEDGNVD